MQNAIFVTVIMLTGRKTPWRKLRAGYILAAARVVLIFGRKSSLGQCRDHCLLTPVWLAVLARLAHSPP